MKRKFGCLLAIGIALTIVGPFFLVRSCLSGYDEYSVEGNVRLFRNSSAHILVYIKNYYKVSSYSQEGGLTSIGGSHRYFLETRNASNLQLLKSTRLKVDDNQYPTIVGNSGKILWIFNGELLGYDPFTHNVICDEDKLASLNSVLKNNFPRESRYFTFDYTTNQLDIFTKNAHHYGLTDNFKATLKEEDNEKEPADVTQLKIKLDKYKELQKNDKHGSYYLLWDSIRDTEKHIESLKNEYQNQKDFRARLNEMHSGNAVDLDDLITNLLVKDSFVYALSNRKELDTANHYVYVNQNFSTEEQKYLSKAILKEVSKSRGMYSWIIVEKQALINTNQSFLKGYFLLDKETLQAVTLHNPESWLVLSAREIGQNSPLILQRVDYNSKIVWSRELPVKSFKDMFQAGNYLIICSEKDDYLNENKQSDLLLSIDLNSGTFLQSALK